MSPTVKLLSKEETYRDISPRALTVTYFSVSLPLRYFIYFTLLQGILLFVLESLDHRLARRTAKAELKKKKFRLTVRLLTLLPHTVIKEGKKSLSIRILNAFMLYVGYSFQMQSSSKISNFRYSKI